MPSICACRESRFTWQRGQATTIASAPTALALAKIASGRRLRVEIVVVLALPAVLVAGLSGSILLNWGPMGRWLGVKGVLAVSDMVTFGLLALVCVFVLRLLADRARVFSLLEVSFVAGSVAVMLADHRNRMLNRPRFFSDWAWSMGIDPTHVLMAVGTALALLAPHRGMPGMPSAASPTSAK